VPLCVALKQACSGYDGMVICCASDELNRDWQSGTAEPTGDCERRQAA